MNADHEATYVLDLGDGVVRSTLETLKPGETVRSRVCLVNDEASKLPALAMREGDTVMIEFDPPEGPMQFSVSWPWLSMRIDSYRRRPR